jgi:glutamate synthase (NADPH/NADH) large chain
LLEDWDGALSRFIKVMPRDYKGALLDQRAEAIAAATVAAE